MTVVTDKAMKQVLLVAYHYPPSPAVGAVRPSLFTRYLPEFGWSPTVVAAAPPDRPAALRSATQSPATVEYVREWPHPIKAYERWQERRAARHGRAERHAARVLVPYERCVSLPNRFSVKRNLLLLASLPDRENTWLVPGLRRSLQIIRRTGGRHLITTGPPFTCHLIGLLLAKMTGVKWIADFRDPWSLKHKFPIWRTGLTDVFERRFIRSVMQRADVVLSVTPAMTDEARKEHYTLPPERFQTLTSGFDPMEFEGIEWVRPGAGPIVFSYFGTFYHGRTPEPFLTALSLLIKDWTLNPDDIRVRFVGQVMSADGESVQAMVNRLGLHDLVSLHAPVPRAEALKQTLESHVVLVLDERHPVQIPFKVYDALAAGPIILNIGSRGAVAEVVMRTGRGVAVHHQNPADVRKGILTCIRRARAKEPGPMRPWDDPAVQEFDVRRLTAHLAAYLDAL